jgi:hypothetical protein
VAKLVHPLVGLAGDSDSSIIDNPFRALRAMWI